MGGLFSSKPVVQPTPQPSYDYYPRSYTNEPPRRPAPQPTVNVENYWTHVRTQPVNPTPVIWPTPRPSRAAEIIIKPGLFNLQSHPSYSSGSLLTYTRLSEYDPDYITITGRITNRRRFRLERILKVNNPILEMAYEMKKEEKGGSANERLLFHGTKLANVDNICKLNFDWRRQKTHRFGRGVSFSPNVNYASHYSDNSDAKIMIVAKVLVTRSCLGNDDMEIPPEGYDASHKNGGVVIVKYDDNEFFPAFLLNYHLNGHQQNQFDD